MQYVARFNLAKNFVLNTKVTHVEPVNGGKDGFQLTLSTNSTPQHYDWILMCTGMNESPKIPNYPGQEKFKGETSHSASWTGCKEDLQSCTKKRVLVVGTGESGSDIIAELAHLNGGVSASVRGNTFVIPRMALGCPPDHIECPALYSMPHWLRSAFVMMDMPRLRNWRTSFKTNFWLFNHKWPKLNFLAGQGITKADTFMKAVDRDLVTFYPEVKRFVNDYTVEFVDGSRADFDKVIWSTGYYNLRAEKWFPALNTNFKKLYKACFCPEMPNVGFVAYCRGVVGGVIGPAEIQSRWVALVISGKRKLPPIEEMTRQRDIDMKETLKNHQVMRTSNAYSCYIAKHEVGCYPKFLQIFFRNPGLAWKMWGSCVGPAHFRFNGPHADPKSATAVFDLGRRPSWYWSPWIALITPYVPLWDLPWFRYLSPFQKGEDIWY